MGSYHLQSMYPQLYQLSACPPDQQQNCNIYNQYKVVSLQTTSEDVAVLVLCPLQQGLSYV